MSQKGRIAAAHGPSESTTQMGSRSVQPFLHISPQCVYTLQWAAHSQSTLPIPMGILDPLPNSLRGSLSPPKATATTQTASDRFSRFYRDHESDRPTYHATRSVRSTFYASAFVVLGCGLIMEKHMSKPYHGNIIHTVLHHWFGL